MEDHLNQTSLLEYAKKYVQWVYDYPIDLFFDEYRFCQRELQTFPIEFRDATVAGMMRFWFSISLLWFDYLDRHEEYQIFIDVNNERKTKEVYERCDEQRMLLPKGNGYLKKAMMGQGGMVDSLSKYSGHIDPQTRQTLESIFSASRIPSSPYPTDAVPEYYEKRPYLKRFGISLMREVYDFAIQCGYTQMETVTGVLPRTPKEEETLRRLIHLTACDFILCAVGLFESYDFWLIECSEGTEIHITYTDDPISDPERLELTSDIHDEEENGMINVFSVYGYPTEQ